MNILQTIISASFTLMGSVLTYFLSLKKMDTKIKEIEINAETEISKIKEESNKEIEKLKAEHEEYRKTRKSDSKINSQEKLNEYINQMTYKFFEDLMNDPDNADKKIATITKLEKKFPNKNK